LDALLEKELTPVQKAHLFLGYLSPVLGADEKSETENGDEPTHPVTP
jgi:hypothetical protein